jgi:hypothetical protein
MDYLYARNRWVARGDQPLIGRSRKDDVDGQAPPPAQSGPWRDIAAHARLIGQHLVDRVSHLRRRDAAVLPRAQERPDLRDDGGDGCDAGDRLERRLREQTRLRTTVTLGEPRSLPRQEVGKAKRVFEWHPDEPDPFPVTADTIST